MKKGYILVRISIHNPELFKEYPPLSGPTMEKFGGKYLIRGGKFEIAEEIGQQTEQLLWNLRVLKRPRSAMSL